jgi:hypothetical protein
LIVLERGRANIEQTLRVVVRRTLSQIDGSKGPDI